MATAKRKEGHRVVFVEVPEDLVARLKALAAIHHRSMSGEVIEAVERHVLAFESASGDNGKAEPKKGSKARTER